MTGDDMCGVFTSDRVLAGWWGSQWKASDRIWVCRCTTGCERWQVYKCECWWDHCDVLDGCLLFFSLCSSGFQDLLRLKLPSLLRCWSLAFHSLLHHPARTLSAITTPHIPFLVILHPPAYEDVNNRGFRNDG